MADASKQLDIPDARDTTSATETLAADRALARERGGTGVSVATKAALAAEYVATGASAGAAGTSGMVPIAAAGDQRKALRGDATHSTELHLTKVVDAAGAVARVATSGLLYDTGEQVLDIEATGDGLNRVWVSAAGTGTGRGRIGTRGADSHVSLTFEPKGVSRPDHVGDPFCSILKPSRRITAVAFGTTFDTHGWPTLTVTSPGGATSSFDDGTGSYVAMTTAATVGSVAGLSTSATVTKRQCVPQLIHQFNVAMAESRIWLGLFSGDPSSHDEVTFVNAGIQGFGFYYDDGPHTGSLTGGVVVVDAATDTYTRSDGISYLDQGFHVGQTVQWFGFVNSANNTPKTIATLSASAMKVNEACTDETSPGGGVHCDGPAPTSVWKCVQSSTSAVTFTDTDTSSLTPNEQMAFRQRHLSGSTFDYSSYNFNTSIWQDYEEVTGTAPAAGGALKFYALIRAGTATSRAIRYKCAELYSR